MLGVEASGWRDGRRPEDMRISPEGIPCEWDLLIFGQAQILSLRIHGQVRENHQGRDEIKRRV